MKLYVGVLSLFSAKARIALCEKGLHAELVYVPWSRSGRYEPHHPDVVALNPKRQVPVLVDGSVAVYDSTQIFEYLEERAPEPPLYPSGLAERARCRRLEAAADEIWFPHVWDLIEGRFYPSAPTADDADASRVQTAVQALAELGRQLEKELVDRSFLCGKFGVADIATFIQVHTATILGAPLPEDCPAVSAWCRRVGERPSVAPILAEMMQAAADSAVS